MSVTMPVTWVVRICASEILVMIAFCSPIVKHSTATNSRLRWVQVSCSASSPNSSTSHASTTSTLA